MSNPETNCAFCDIDTLKREKRIIRATDKVLSIVSNPRITDFHCVIFPRDHIATNYDMDASLRHEFADEEALLQQATVEACKEQYASLGKVANISYFGFAKPEPADPENGISVYGHFHSHALPLVRPDMSELVPAPHSPNKFRQAPSDALVETRDLVRKHMRILTT